MKCLISFRLFVNKKMRPNRLKKYFYALSFVGTTIGGMAVCRSYLSGDLYQGKEEMYGKTVIVTGANTGIGKETAKELAKRGNK